MTITLSKPQLDLLASIVFTALEEGTYSLPEPTFWYEPDLGRWEDVPDDMKLDYYRILN